MIQRLIANWKTTSAGLLMAVGALIHLIFAIKNHTADENTWTITAGAILGGLGLMFAGDASTTDAKVNTVATAVDKINQEGTSSFSELVATQPVDQTTKP